MYLSYDEYTGMGGEMNAALYPRMEMKARRMIDQATHGRLADMDPVPDPVRFCVYEMIRMLDADEAAGGDGREITGISNDGVSVSYAAGNGAAGPQARYMNVIRMWLSGETDRHGTPLMYAGVDA